MEISILGRCIDRLLVRKELRKCSIIGHREMGVKLDNGTYTGVLGLLQRKKADLYMKGRFYIVLLFYLKVAAITASSLVQCLHDSS